ncbi:hypothetical protein DM02DRAFT_655681 [Periconia macrospinosa]|uniref:Kinesin light chain n=1 Tax=Periconia macrospinosa TaxID=97972 RepID=A0A2V1DPR7_9PLEO|nr:hypothetical protein DM02DRAFT_655681 [Periconia macrospinosa]
MDEAEAMYQRALQGNEKARGPEHLSTYVPALNTMWGLASLRDRQHRVEDARTWYSKALLGYESAVGSDHPKCRRLRSDLASLGTEQNKVNPTREELSMKMKASEASRVSIKEEGVKSASKRHRLFSKLRWKGG